MSNEPTVFKGHDLEAEILAQVTARGADKSICPSEVAKKLEKEEPAWRKLLKPIRTTATRMAQEDKISILRHGKPIDPNEPFRGVIRLQLKAG